MVKKTLTNEIWSCRRGFDVESSKTKTYTMDQTDISIEVLKDTEIRDRCIRLEAGVIQVLMFLESSSLTSMETRNPRNVSMNQERQSLVKCKVRIT